MRIVVLNGFPLNAIGKRQFTANVRETSLHELAKMIPDGTEVIHYIRHASTLEVLRKYIPLLPESPNSGLYKWQEGDVIVSITLRNPPRGAADVAVTENDILVHIVTIS